MVYETWSSEGSLQEPTFDLFKKAGYRIRLSERSYVPSIDDADMECLLIRAQEMGHYVEDGVLDAGITGQDWVREYESDVVEVAQLLYARGGFVPVRWVVAVPGRPTYKYHTACRKTDRHGTFGYTSVFERCGTGGCGIQLGATEVKPRCSPMPLSMTVTGSSLGDKLRIIDLSSSHHCACHEKAAWEDP